MNREHAGHRFHLLKLAAHCRRPASWGRFRLDSIRPFLSVVRFLALQTICSPRHCREAFRRDRLLAIETYPELAVMDPLERASTWPKTLVRRFTERSANSR